MVNSCINEKKRNVILDEYDDIIKKLKKHRKAHKKKMLNVVQDIEQPAWTRVNPAPSLNNDTNSYRLCVGFKNIGCKYRDTDEKKLGCLNCGYYATTAFKNINQETILLQLKNSFKIADKESMPYNSIEFLNDGSFINYEEFNKSTQESIFNIVNKMPHIKRVLIESKAEYILEHNITFLLDILRDDQKLEVGIGLESYDDFIRDICINKGFSIDIFENSIKILSNLDNKYKNRVSIITYLLVKPAFISQKEAINDIINTLEYLALLSSKYEVEIIPKLEPAAIVDGTILSMLYFDKDSKFNYKPLNYWAVLEILASVYLNPLTKSFISNIRIGAREDMDDILKIPAIYNEDGTFHQFDFVLYEVIQKFNQHHDILRVFEVLSDVYIFLDNASIIDIKSSLSKFYKNFGIENKAIEKFYELESSKSNINRFEIKQEIAFLKTLSKVLDIMEGYDSNNIKIQNEIIKSLNSKDKINLIKNIEMCFDLVDHNKMIEIYIINIVYNKQNIQVFFDVKDLLSNSKFSLWSIIKK